MLTFPPSRTSRRRLLKGATAVTGATAVGWPALSFAQNRPIRIGMPTILSGRVAQLGLSSHYGASSEVEKFNAAGGLGGRPIELVVRDSKGQPQEAARVARELVNSDDCEILLDAEASSGAFAVHEVVRDLGVLCLHSNSETASLTADPAMRIPNAFRTARQSIHDAIVGGNYAAHVAKTLGLRRWMSCSPDYVFGRDTTADFFVYLQHFNPNVEIIGNGVWPKLFQPDYTESITRLLQARPQAIYSALWGGDLTSFVEQSSIYALFNNRTFFAYAGADYTALSAIKNFPPDMHSGNRYLRSVPNAPGNHAWADAYFAKHREMPTTWAWENATAIMFLTAAMRQTNSTDGTKLAEAMRGMTIDCPFGADGTITMRAEDQTIINYANAWGKITNREPYMPEPQLASWHQIQELELAWKKDKGWA